MDLQEAKTDFVNRFLDFHTNNCILPPQFLSWEFLTKHPETFANERLDGIDWDMVPSLFSAGELPMIHDDQHRIGSADVDFTVPF